MNLPMLNDRQTRHAYEMQLAGRVVHFILYWLIAGFDRFQLRGCAGYIIGQSQALLPVLYQLYDIGRKQRRAMAVSGYDVAAYGFIGCVER